MSATVTDRDREKAKALFEFDDDGECIASPGSFEIAATIAAERARVEAPLLAKLVSAQTLLDDAQLDHARITELENLRAAEERINRDQHKALCRREETITKLTRERDEAAQERERWKDTAQKAANEALRRAPPTYPTDRTETL